jgi:endonuclease YncB( thermonuclease family)
LSQTVTFNYTQLSQNPESSEQAEVISVPEGDVLVIRLGGSEKMLRLCEIDAPAVE